MPGKTKRFIMYLLLTVCGTTLFQSNAGFCRLMGSDGVLVSTNFCFIFDCQNGILGGVFQPCSPVPLLTDCPELQN